MRSSRRRGFLLLALGFILVIFYTTFITASTYYNPAATLVIIILGAFISIGGVLSLTKKAMPAGLFFMNPRISRVRGVFPILFILTILALSADVFLTLYAVSSFGFRVEANKVVTSLIRSGNIAAWLGQQFAPAFIAGLLFALFKNIYLRTMVTFFTIGTLGYAIATVINDLIVINELSAPRA